MLFGREPPEFVAAFEAAMERLAAQPWSRLSAFDATMRARTLSPPVHSDRWRNLRPDDVASLGRRFRRPALAWALLATHSRGHVREAVIRELAAADDEIALPILLLRASDWVTPVSDAAIAALGRKRATGVTGAWIALLPLLESLAGERARGSAFAREVHRWVVEGAQLPALIDPLRSTDRRFRHAVARALVARPPADGALLAALPVALAQDDPVTARLLADAWCERGSEAVEPLERMLASRYAQVRRRALARVLQLGGARADAAALAALDDAVVSVRWIAQHHVKERGLDLAAHYEGLLATNPAVALRGLAEIGALRDVARVAPFLAAPRSGVRAIAVREYGRLGGREVAERVAGFLDDESPRVARAAAETLVLAPPSAAVLELAWRIAERGAHGGARKAVFFLFRCGSRWTLLAMAARALASDDAALAEFGRSSLDYVLQRWNQSFAPPDPSTAEELRRSLSGLRTRLPHSTWDLLALTVRQFLGPT